MARLHPRLSTFVHAWHGLRVLLRQPNARIHVVAALVVVGLSFHFSVSRGEWLALILAMTLVIAAEALNTALEHLVDIASPNWSELARDAKDVAAAAVLVCAIGAACVGALIFVPHLL